MKKFKKVMALSLALAMGLSLAACGKDDDDTTTTEAPKTEDTKADTEAPTEDANQGGDESGLPIPMPSADGAKINVYSWNEELGSRIATHFNSRYPELANLVNYVNLDVSGTGDEYKSGVQNAIDAGGDLVPSVVAADNDVARYFAEQSWAVPLSSIGLTNAMYADAYNFTVDYATMNGELMAMTWQAPAGGFAYRLDIAEEVLGASDPDSVQAYVKDWDTFLDTAQKMKDAGYYMLSGNDDIKYAMIDQKVAPWVVDGALNIDQSVYDYLELSKKLYDNGYTHNTSMWDSDWSANMTGDVFGYFGCTWFVQWSLTEASHGTWNMCEGPVPYHWGGSYMVVTNKCTNPELAALLIYTICCDEEVAYDLYAIDYDYPNNQAAVARLIADGKGSNPILNGQDPLVQWDALAKNISLKNATSYDATFNGYLDSASSAYNSGELSSVDAAIANIKSQVANAYSDITVE